MPSKKEQRSCHLLHVLGIPGIELHGLLEELQRQLDVAFLSGYEPKDINGVLTGLPCLTQQLLYQDLRPLEAQSGTVGAGDTESNSQHSTPNTYEMSYRMDTHISKWYCVAMVTGNTEHQNESTNPASACQQTTDFTSFKVFLDVVHVNQPVLPLMNRNVRS